MQLSLTCSPSRLQSRMNTASKWRPVSHTWCGHARWHAWFIVRRRARSAPVVRPLWYVDCGDEQLILHHTHSHLTCKAQSTCGPEFYEAEQPLPGDRVHISHSPSILFSNLYIHWCGVSAQLSVFQLLCLPNVLSLGMASKPPHPHRPHAIINISNGASLS